MLRKIITGMMRPYQTIAAEMRTWNGDFIMIDLPVFYIYESERM